MARVVIFGIGGAGRLAYHYFTRDSDHEVVAFTVDPEYCLQPTLFDLPVVPFPQVPTLYPPRDYQLFVAMGYGRMNHDRAGRYHAAKEAGYPLVSYVSSRATYLSDHPIGDNCFILEDVTVQPFVRIGNNVTLWSRCIVTHDCIIEDHCFLAAGCVVLGYVHVHPYCFIGANATIRHNLTLAPESHIGAGAILMHDTVPQGVYLPPPAILLSKTSDQIAI